MASTMNAPRLPFGELSSSRLEQLSATKNQQNAITELLAKGPSRGFHSFDKGGAVSKAPVKRPISASSFADEDGENVDPEGHSSKRAKAFNGTPAKTSSFLLDVTPNSASSFDFSKPASRSLRPVTPPFLAPRSAPAGRSPKHKRVGILSSRKRIDPPSFGSANRGVTKSLFSIDAALEGTVGAASRPKPSRREGQRKEWFFEIHEDTADQVASTIMEHSTATLDLSSDDEAEKPKKSCGKENVPPPEYEEIARQMGFESHATAGRRRRPTSPVHSVEEVSRSPLGGLVAEDFYAAGLNAFSEETVVDDDEAVQSDKLEKKDAIALESVETKPLDNAEAMDASCAAVMGGVALK